MVLALPSHRIPVLGPRGSLSSLSSLPGVFVALEPDRITGLADAAAIATVTEQSVNGNVFANGNAAQRPTFETNEAAGLPVARFVRASTHKLDAASVSGGTGDQLTAIACLKRNSISTVQGIITIGANPNGWTFAFAAGDQLTLHKTNASGFATGTTTITSTSAYVIVAVTYDGRVATFYVNGVGAGATTSAQTFTSGNANSIGSYAGGNTLDADLAAIAAATAVWSPALLSAATKYLAAKYAVALG